MGNGPTPVKAVTVTISGVTYEGTYFVRDSMIYVQSSFSFGAKATELDGSPPESIARLLLLEIVTEAHKT